jgi:hypothetical protein
MALFRAPVLFDCNRYQGQRGPVYLWRGGWHLVRMLVGAQRIATLASKRALFAQIQKI